MKKKFRENLKKKITLAMATILTIGAIPTLNPIDIYAGQSVTYVQSSLGKTGGNVTFKGDNANAAVHNANTAIAVDKDNSNNYGYCISAGLPSVEDGNMVMDIKETLTEKDKNVLGIMNAGFPNNSYGLDQKNAYLATEIAIKHYVLQHPSDYYNAYWATGSREEVKFNNDDWSHWSGDSNIINIAKTIYDTGLANPYNSNSESGSLTVDATDDGELKYSDDTEKLETTISINSTSPYTSGTLTFDDPAIQSMGATVTVDGVVTAINNNTVQLPANAKEVVVSVDKAEAEKVHKEKYPNDDDASKYFTVNATVKTIGNGGSSLNIGINRLGHNGQNYAVMMQGNDIATQQSIKWNRTTQTFDPTPAKLKIVKVEAGTTKGLEGAVFKITSHVEGMEGVLGTYTTNSHPAIISNEDFEKVQQELRRRAISRNKINKVLNTKYVLSDVMICAECGSPYRRVTWRGHYEQPRFVWRCNNRLKNGTKNCKKSPTLDEGMIHNAVMECIATITEASKVEEIVLQNKNAVNKKESTVRINKKKETFEKELEKYKLEIDKLVKDELNGIDVSKDYEVISKKIEDIKNKLKEHEQEKVDRLNINSTVKLDREFDEALVRQLVHRIRVLNNEELEIEFLSAVKVVQKLEV